MNSLDTTNTGASADGTPARRLAAHFFRHHAGRLTANLTRKLGLRRLELVEDSVQAAFVQALRSWSVRGIPTEPSGWLYRVALHLAIDAIRREQVAERCRQDTSTTIQWRHGGNGVEDRDSLAEIADDELRLLCMCCQPSLPAEAQVAFALKTLGGFSAAEIGRALLIPEAAAQKRVARVRDRLREVHPDELSRVDLPSRLPTVLNVIYLLFNEGYYSRRSDTTVRAELCDEALRLGRLVAQQFRGNRPDTSALLALMSFYSARFDARHAGDGSLILMEKQDRSRWDQYRIGEGIRWLRAASTGNELSIYHLEAAISAEHCLAASFEQTNWGRIVNLYDMLVKVDASSVHSLNRAIAINYLCGPQAGLEALAESDADLISGDYFFGDAILGELYRRAGHLQQASKHLRRALVNALLPQEKELLERRLASINHSRDLPQP